MLTLQSTGRWAAAGERLAGSGPWARSRQVQAEVSNPLIHIADGADQAVQPTGLSTVGLLGPAFTGPAATP